MHSVWPVIIQTILKSKQCIVQKRMWREYAGSHACWRYSIAQYDRRQYGFACLRGSAYAIGSCRILAGIRVGTAFTLVPVMTTIPGCGLA